MVRRKVTESCGAGFQFEAVLADLILSQKDV